MERESILLKNWKFGLGNDVKCLENGRKVSLPHTWNVEQGSEEYWGTGWYEYDLHAPEEWADKRIIVHFHAVYHDAEVWLNNQRIAEHKSSGYTPFDVELTEYLNIGAVNELLVRVNNEFSDNMLPYQRSFDWANDGGIIREVQLWITGKSYIRNIRITADPILEAEGKRLDGGAGLWGMKVQLDAADTAHLSLNWEIFQEDGKKIREGIIAEPEAVAGVEHERMENVQYWHFDQPHLYTVAVKLQNGEFVDDEVKCAFGFRNFQVKGSRFFLNGEQIRICGTEWMPGSNPEFGMAEPKSQLEKMLVRLKESNCVFTRFHWQQDDFVYDWCDRHGMLVQEEIPFWGRDPELIEEKQWEISRMQIDEMIEAHYNHPSIIAWGVGNELDGQADETNQYIRDAVSYVHRLDQRRAVNYVSNSFWQDAGKDGTTAGDIMMINEYVGTWLEGDVQRELEKMIHANPGKPLVPSEFGLCEPYFKGGDERRTDIFLKKTEIYRQYEEIAGFINFCLNDYRTQIGEDGTGKWKKRIHGSTDLTGRRKPSYFIVQRECAPFQIVREESGIRFICRNTIPSYSVSGYYIELFEENKTSEFRIEIPVLQPGEEWRPVIDTDKRLAVYRANGDFAGIY